MEKEQRINRITEPLEGEDARRLVEYISDPTPPDGHTEYIDKSDEAFRENPNPGSANVPFES
jgi:hypothetical protein